MVGMAWRAARAARVARLFVNSASSETTSALARFSARAAKAISKSPSTLAFNVLSNPASDGVQLAHGRRVGDVVPVDQERNQRSWRNQFAYKLQALGPERIRDHRYAGQVAARPIEAGNEAGSNRIAARGEHDRHSCGCHPQGAGHDIGSARE